MRAKKMITWALAIPMVIICLMIIIVKLDSSNNYISRAMASKAMALALTDKTVCVQSQRENGSHFSAGEQEEWYAKYMDYLADGGYFETEEPSAFLFEAGFAEDALTYGEAAYAAEQVKPGLSRALNISKKKYKKPMPKEEWWLFYDSFLKAADTGAAVQEKKLYLYGTPDNVKEAAPWTAYTSDGVMGFDGLALDSLIDHELKILCRGGEIIRLTEDVSDKVTYKNVWMVPAENSANMYIGTIVRELPEIEELQKETGGVLADVTLERGRLKKISLKRDTIEGTVLAVREDSIEIEGYGTLKLDSDFKVYKTYGMIKEQKKKDVLVGYDLGKFVIAGRKVCAALLTKDFAAKNIRVLIMDDEFSSVFHEEIILKSDGVLKIHYGETEELLESGTKIILKPGDERLSQGRMRVETADPQKQITVVSLNRQQGTPSYYGSFEISSEPDGLILLNDVDIEDYLTRVVPSEMPASYELEALKAQAVCARTYACRQIQANAYSQYGAHVDDSTNYQVYNNIESSERTDLAVKETDGLAVYYGEKPAETYYFATSCGHTTDGTIWGASLEEVPYLRGISLTKEHGTEELTTNDAFIPYIKEAKSGTYDSGYPMYRWKTKITNQKLAEKITGIGEIQGIFVTERGTGGIAKTVTVVGSTGKTVLKGQTQIRNTLGCPELTYTKNDGSTAEGFTSLPSAFIAVDETARDEEAGIRTFTIWGGGFGHGVGMSQNGAHQMAREGKTFDEILKFFYTGVEIKEMENQG